MPKAHKKRKVRKSSSRKSNADFFGINKSPSYLGGKSNISFLNSKQKPLKRVKQRKVNPLFNQGNKKKSNSKQTNFLSRTKVMPKQKHINWNYKQIKKKFPGINPYGDADMDGSMNYKDCKPFDASKDGFFARALSIVTGGKKGQSKEDYATERAEKKQRKVGARIAEGMLRRQKIEKLKKGITEKFEAKGRVLSEEELQRKAKRKQTLKEMAETPRKIHRKLLYKKVPITKKGKVVGHKTVLRGGKPVSTAVLKTVALAGIPVKIPKEKGKAGKSGKTYASAGRPKGPSGKYQIPGKGPVYEHEYKKWLTKQRALARIQAEQSRGIPQEDVSEAPESNEVLEEYGEQEGVQEPQPQQAQPQQLTPEQIQRIRQIQLARQQQALAQQSQQTRQVRQPIRPPSQTVGGPVQDHILNAPNVARGELRTARTGREIQSTTLGARPQVNPGGEYYTNIDPMTGKSIMQRRVREKFATVGDGDL